MRLRELHRRQIAERVVRPLGVVLDTPFLNQTPGMAHGNEPVLVQTSIAESTVEALDVSVFHWLAGPDERQHDIHFVGSCIQHLTSEQRAVVRRDGSGPRISRNRSSTCLPQRPGNEVSTSIARHSRV